MDKKDVHQAAVATTGHLDSQTTHYEGNVAISLVVNSRGRTCLIHEGAFEATPVWVKYLTDKRKIQFVYDNGTNRIIDFIMEDKIHKKLLNINKIFLVRTDKGVPIEGFDTTLLKE